MIKKLRVTVDGNTYDVTVELPDDSAAPALTVGPLAAPAQAPTPAVPPVISAPAAPGAAGVPAAPAAAPTAAGPGECPVHWLDGSRPWW